jgi:hypothetical protein
MQIDTLPVHAPVPDPESGEDRQVAVALLLMNDPADDGRTSGWYWTEVPRNPEPEDLMSRQRWTGAVAAQQGPFRDANTALAAAENHTPEGLALAARLGQAAELLRAGEIEATPETVADWLRNTGGATAPLGPDPEGARDREDPDELQRMLAEGEVPDPDADGGQNGVGDEPLDIHDRTAGAEADADGRAS